MKDEVTINDIMTKNPYAINVETRITEIIKLMEENNFDHFPILDNSNYLKGIISKTDLYHKALSISKATSGKLYSEKLLNTTKAKEIMTQDPVFVESSQSVDYATELLLQNEFHALPVVENNLLVGIITSKDILEYIADKKIADS